MSGSYSGPFGLSQVTGGAAGYQGPGDIVGSAFAWWGLRAFSRATALAGSRALIVKDSLNTTIDLFLKTDGSIDLTPLTGNTPYVLTRLEDQTGNGWHLDQVATTGPTFVSNGIASGKPTLLFNGTTDGMSGTKQATGNVAFPCTNNGFANSTNNSAGQTLFGSQNITTIGYDASGVNPNTVNMSDGTIITATASDGAWHCVNAVFVGSGTSSLQVDSNSPVTGATSGTTFLVTSGTFLIGQFSALSYFKGPFTEGGYWASVLSGSTCTQLSTNAHNYWGV